MNRTNLGLIAALVLLVGALVYLGTRRGAGAGALPPVRTGVLRPSLRVVSPSGAEVPSGKLSAPVGQPIDLRVVLEANAFVYLFDEVDNQTLLMWKHADAAPWEKGEYAADAPALEGRGLHRLVVVASPTPLRGVDEWKMLTPDSLERSCPACELNDYTLFITGGDGGSASLSGGY